MDTEGTVDGHGRWAGRRPSPPAHRAGYVLEWSAPRGGAMPSAEAQLRAAELVEHLARVAPVREQLEIAVFSASPADGGNPCGDLGLRERRSDPEVVAEPIVDLFFDDGAGLNRPIASTSWSELGRRLGRLLRIYMVEGCGNDTFAAWTRAMPDGLIRERLGLPATEPTSSLA